MAKYARTYGTARNVRRVGHIDIPGGGQVTVENGRAYVGHFDPPHGTSILDVTDPKNIRVLSQLEIPIGTQSHKVRVHEDVMLINLEKYQNKGEPFQGGLKIFDVSNPSRPREIAFFSSGAGCTGVHRFDFDGHYAYLSPHMDGYLGNIVLILDLRDPTKPEEAGRWWLPGQWTAGGETPTWEGKRHRCHHPLRFRDRLYTSYWHAGLIILDISDIGRPRMVGRLDWSPPYPCPTHTVLPVPHDILGRRFLVVTDEETFDRLAPRPNAFLWMVDVTEETNPIPVATWFPPEQDADFDDDERLGAHQPQEQVYPHNRLSIAWFAGGIRILDINDPYHPNEVGYFIPEPGKGQSVVYTNDVFMDSSGLIYAIDRLNGLDILEYAG